MPARVRLALMVFASLSILAAAGVIVFAKPPKPPATSAGGFAGSLRPAIPPKDFTLSDEAGRRISLRRYRGQVVVLTFLYSTCRDTCPLTATTIRGALDEIGHDVPALAVSVDPTNDTPDNVERFLVRQRVSGGRMHFLTGSRAQLARVWRDYGIQPQGRGFEHSAYVLLIDKQGRQRVSFPVEQLTDRGLAHDIRRLEGS
ncbi:MAG: SCO family protein [Solirubrobacteraceae bacterium]